MPSFKCLDCENRCTVLTRGIWKPASCVCKYDEDNLLVTWKPDSNRGVVYFLLGYGALICAVTVIVFKFVL